MKTPLENGKLNDDDDEDEDEDDDEDDDDDDDEDYPPPPLRSSPTCLRGTVSIVWAQVGCD